LVPVITNVANGRIVLGQLAYGNGLALLGGMTTDNYHSPQPQSANLRANILAYGANAPVICTNCAPAIVSQPTNQIVGLGGSVQFFASCSGTAPLNYQWQLGGVPIPSATNASHVITAAAWAHAGDYRLVVTNLYGAATSAVAVLTVVTSLPVVINFDEFSAPCNFSETVRLTNRYAALGVVFAGPGGLDGGAALNQCGVFGVSGHSTPNFLAFNATVAMGDGGLARGPETLIFSNALASFSLRAGSGPSGPATLLAYNTNNLLIASNYVQLISQLQTFQVNTAGIARVVISSTASHWVVDDITFTVMPPAPPVPPGLVFKSAVKSPGGLRLTIGTTDSSPITPDRATNIWVYAATNAASPLSNWTAVANAPVLTNGVLVVDGINTLQPPARFFRAIEGIWNVQPLRLQFTPAAGAGYALRAGNPDGSPLTPARAPRVGFFTSTNAALPFAAWLPVTGPTVLSNGVLSVTSPGLTNGPARYFRARETP